MFINLSIIVYSTYVLYHMYIKIYNYFNVIVNHNGELVLNTYISCSHVEHVATK